MTSLSGLSNNRSYLSAFLTDNPELGEIIDSVDNNPGILQYDNDLSVESRSHSLADSILNQDRNFLLYNPLSSQWHFAEMKANPFSLPFIYLLGTIGYAIALAIRVVIFVVTLFKLIAEFFKLLCDGASSEQFKKAMGRRAMIFLGATGELAFGVVGVVCPPAAYKGDEWVQSNMMIHSWYLDSFLSVWKYELDGRLVTENDVGIGGSVGNENRIELKKIRVADQLKNFDNAGVELKKYTHEDEMSSMIDVGFRAAALGMVHSFSQGKSLAIFRDEALDKYPEKKEEEKIKKAQRKDTYDGYLADFEKHWNAIVIAKKAKESVSSRWAALPLVGKLFQDDKEKKEESSGVLATQGLIRAIKYELILDGDDSTLINGKETREKLEGKLKALEDFFVEIDGQEITLRQTVKAMAKIIWNFAHDICDTDREMHTILLKSAFETVNK